MITVFSALKAGKSLRNVAGWKNVQLTSQLVGAVLTFVVHILPLFGVNLPIADADLADITGKAADGVAAFLFVFSAYLTPATTDKIGLPSTRIEGD